MARPMQRRRKTTPNERICAVCARHFNKAEHLERHLRSHTKEKPFQCPTCAKGFARQDTLLRHSRSHHDQAGLSGGPQESIDSLSDASPPLRTDFPSQIPGNTRAGDPVADLPQLLGSSVGQDGGILPMDHLTRGIAHPGMGISESYTGIALGGLYNDSLHSIPSPGDDYDILAPFSADWSMHDLLWRPQFAGNDYHMSLPDFPSEMTVDDPLRSVLGPPETPSTTSYDSNRIESQSENSSKAESLVQKRWHTYCEPSPDEDEMPDLATARHQVDETYHSSLTDSLRYREPGGSLPRIEFLNMCIQAYFSNFHPIFPIIHPPTFRPRRINRPLLLSICSIGSLYLGSAGAVAHGVGMYERLNRTMLNSWETNIHPGVSSGVVLQAAVLGQTFGIMLGRPRDTVQVDLFHGTVVAWIRKLKIFDIENYDVDIEAVEDEALQQAWKEWSFEEQKRRLVLAILFHDAEITGMLHHDPLLRTSLEEIPCTSSESVFAAPNATVWKELLLREKQTSVKSNPQQNSFDLFPSITNEFALGVMLELIGSQASMAQRAKISRPGALLECQNVLIKWYETYRHTNGFEKRAPGLMVLWHADFMLLNMNMDVLERACGRDGEDDAEKYKPKAKVWARSKEALRCLVHAILIQRHFETIPLGREPPIHANLCLYRCGIAWFCCTHFGEGVLAEIGGELDFPEFKKLGVDVKRTLEDNWPRDGRSGAGPLYRVIDLLRRIIHCKAARSFAATLLAIYEGS